MVDMSPCPDSSQLHEFALGASSAKHLSEHISACADCQRNLKDLRADETLAQRLRDAAGLQQEVALRQLLQTHAGNEYEILEPIGRGGRGVVFKARDLKLNRFVAVKSLFDAGSNDRTSAMLQEARNLARSNHPNIAAIFAVSSQPDAPFIVMELVDGQPLTDALARRPLQQQLDGFAQALRAVSELHRRGLVHRDLKPGNILVDRQGVVKLVDFGMAGTPGHEMSSSFEGTPAYLAPEQSFGQPAHPAADVFSLGVILFELLTGQRPFAGHTAAQVITAIRLADPPLPRSLREEIPGALQAICLTALEKDPARRYPSATQFLIDLERFVHGEAVYADPTLLVSVLEHGIDRHVSDLNRWQGDRLISTREFDYFLNRYDRLRQCEEFWVLDSRRISFSQVILHLGVWACAVSAFLMLAFPWPGLGAARPVLPAILAIGLLGGGLVLWKRRTPRVALVLLIGAAMACPIAIATTLVWAKALAAGDRQDDLFEGTLANYQLFAATLSGLALGLLLWRITRTAAFALICGLLLIAAATTTFGLLGLREQLRQGRLDIICGWYLWPGALLVLIAMAWDLRAKIQSFAAPLYVMGLILLLLSLTLIAHFGPTPRWLGLTGQLEGEARTRQVQYSLMGNGLLYLFAGAFANRSAASAWLRRIGTLMFWLAPSHILIPVLRLENDWPIFASSWTAAEILLPLGALGFIFASVPRQMKSFFFSGLVYLAISVQRLTARHFEDNFAWPVTLAVTGIMLALLAWRYPSLFDKKRSDSPRS
ncbi:MAG TPA: serine/threonine-protein kinase [Tepidisphaeraceae bacterium]|nr:serine/threonine-protein kinase [Tepidisphaeraceae bacterium]